MLSPRQYYALISQVDSNILNRDYGNTQGDLNSGAGLYEIAGISIKRSNNLPFMLNGTGTNDVVELLTVRTTIMVVTSPTMLVSSIRRMLLVS